MNQFIFLCMNWTLNVFKSELVQQGGGAWEQRSVRLHLHLDEQKEEKWASSVKLARYSQIRTSRINNSQSKRC